MNVARDIAGFTIPFTFGVLLTVYAGTSFCNGPIILISIVPAVLALSSTALLMRRSIRLETHVIQGLVITCACLCGALSGISGLIQGIELPASAIEDVALGFCIRMQEAIARIPFSSPDTGSLIQALLTGERGSLTRDITEAFRDSGASHILALSGLHLGIIYGILHRVLSLFGNSVHARYLRSVIIIISCGFYTIATGAGPSIVRAFLFILLGETARLTGRKFSLSQLLLSALLIQLIFSPLSIRSIGFQLSYMAIAGIAFIYPRLKGFWPSDEASTSAGKLLGNGMKRIWNHLALSISCQITTAPLAYLYFGTFPLNFLLTNLLALPLTGILIPSSLLTLVLSDAGRCPEILLSTTESLAQAMIRSLHVIASM